ncbi:MAG: leucine-rich repeat domain-containing protein [Lachnospiraceae bacterium]|nr:leucine-rich repeat domain-containing protein [Lachnospiraceae bacterium]
MRKSTALAIVIVMVLSLAACGSNAGGAGADGNEDIQAQTTVTEESTAEEIEEPTDGPTEPSIEFIEPEKEFFGYYYDETLEGVVITRYIGEEEAIRIPAVIRDEPVKLVFLSDNTYIKHVELPDGVTSISEGAFSGCSSLTRVTIPDSVTNIEDGAFRDCPNLTVTYMGQEYTHESDTNWW